MAAIVRGNAPDDFWARCGRHVDVWARYAAIAPDAGGDPGGDPDVALLARGDINAGFDGVERIARHYGALPPGN